MNQSGVPVAKACSIRVEAAPGLVMATLRMELGRTAMSEAEAEAGLKSRFSGAAMTAAASATKTAATFMLMVVEKINLGSRDWSS